jgi:hypothetical protein
MSIAIIATIAIVVLVLAAIVRNIVTNKTVAEAERAMRVAAGWLEDGQWSNYAGDFEAAHRNYRRAARRFARVGDRRMAEHCVRMARQADKGLENAWY